MYESHFGFTGSPFQLNPDPAFYFDSRGHRSALAYLKFGAHQGEGFIVVTGEIGAGKTTLVRTLLESLDPARVVAAQIVSTQLESGDLLRTILTAFGVAQTGTTKSHLLSTLEAFLTAVAAKGRRSLLIVDEAQNLDRGAVEELRMLSNFQLGNQGLLQSFLVGQPELRVLLQSKSMEQLRQRVIASCHLGPLDAVETRAYIEHRLHHVGWVGNPAFDHESYEHVHHWTGGIPRRINRLCNRLMLGAFLADSTSISAEGVDRTALDLGAEIGEALPAPPPVARPAPARPSDGGAASDGIGHFPVELRQRKSSGPGEPLLCLADTLADHLKVGALSDVFVESPSLPPVVAVLMGGSAHLASEVDASGMSCLPGLDIYLNLDHCSGAVQAALALTRFDAILAERAPAAVLAIGSSDCVLACAMLAFKRGVPVLRTGAGQRRAWVPPGKDANSLLLDQFADVLYSCSLVTNYSLHRAGIAVERVHCVGDLAENVVRRAQENAPDPATLQARLGLAGGRLAGSASIGLVTKRFARYQTDPALVFEAVSMLAVARAELPLLWAVDEDTRLEIEASGANAQLRAAGIVVATDLRFVDCVALLGMARCVIAGPEAQFVDEARALGVASVIIDSGIVTPVSLAEPASSGTPLASHHLRKVIHDIVSAEQGQHDPPEFWDGGAAKRIATHLRLWLRKHELYRSRPQLAFVDSEQAGQGAVLPLGPAKASRL